jgi:hypothetical protein
MEELKLVTYMSKWPVLDTLIFLRDHERLLNGDEFKDKIVFEDMNENQAVTQFLFRYVDMIEQRHEGKHYICHMADEPI